MQHRAQLRRDVVWALWRDDSGKPGAQHDAEVVVVFEHVEDAPFGHHDLAPAPRFEAVARE